MAKEPLPVTWIQADFSWFPTLIEGVVFTVLASLVMTGVLFVFGNGGRVAILITYIQTG